MDANTKKGLIDYVTKHYLTPQSVNDIETFCKTQPRRTLTVYRGHDNTSDKIDTRKWHSASISKNIAKKEFAGNMCCLFTIHLVDVPVLNVNSLVGDEIGTYRDEQEVIFLGGGTFFKDKLLTTPGFTTTDDSLTEYVEFECWYTMAPPKTTKLVNPMSIERIVSLIHEDEYDMITSPSDIEVGFPLTEYEKKLVFEEIQKKQQHGGKKRKSKRLSNTKKRHTKRLRNGNRGKKTGKTGK